VPSEITYQLPGNLFSTCHAVLSELLWRIALRHIPLTVRRCQRHGNSEGVPVPIPDRLCGKNGVFSPLLANSKTPWSYTNFYTRALFVAFSDNGACDCCVFRVFTIASSFCYSPTPYLSLNFITRTSQLICLARTLCCTIGVLSPELVQEVYGKGIWKPCTDWIFVWNATRPTPLLKYKRLTFVGGLNYLATIRSGSSLVIFREW